MATSTIPTSNGYSSWTSDDGYIKAFRRGNIVNVTWNKITQGVVTGNVYTLATLPTGFRPLANIYVSWTGINSNEPVSHGRYMIQPDGQVKWCGETCAGTQELSGSACFVAD